MEKAVEVAKEDFAGIRTGRAHPGMFQKLLVDYYGAPTPLQQLASFQNPGGAHDHHQPVRQVLDARHREGDPARPTSASTRATTATIIRCVMPVLTEERRREYVKMAHTPGRGRARSRCATSAATPRPTLEKLVKDGEVGEDEGSRAEKELETRHQEARRPRSTTLLKHKEAELLDGLSAHDDDRRPSRHRRPHRRPPRRPDEGPVDAPATREAQSADPEGRPRPARRRGRSACSLGAASSSAPLVIDARGVPRPSSCVAVCVRRLGAAPGARHPAG